MAGEDPNIWSRLASPITSMVEANKKAAESLAAEAGKLIPDVVIGGSKNELNRLAGSVEKSKEFKEETKGKRSELKGEIQNSMVKVCQAVFKEEISFGDKSLVDLAKGEEMEKEIKKRLEEFLVDSKLAEFGIAPDKKETFIEVLSSMMDLKVKEEIAKKMAAVPDEAKKYISVKIDVKNPDQIDATFGLTKTAAEAVKKGEEAGKEVEEKGNDPLEELEKDLAAKIALTPEYEKVLTSMQSQAFSYADFLETATSFIAKDPNFIGIFDKVYGEATLPEDMTRGADSSDTKIEVAKNLSQALLDQLDGKLEEAQMNNKDVLLALGKEFSFKLKIKGTKLTDVEYSSGTKAAYEKKKDATLTAEEKEELELATKLNSEINKYYNLRDKIFSGYKAGEKYPLRYATWSGDVLTQIQNHRDHDAGFDEDIKKALNPKEPEKVETDQLERAKQVLFKKVQAKVVEPVNKFLNGKGYKSVSVLTNMEEELVFSYNSKTGFVVEFPEGFADAYYAAEVKEKLEDVDIGNKVKEVKGSIFGVILSFFGYTDEDFLAIAEGNSPFSYVFGMIARVSPNGEFKWLKEKGDRLMSIGAKFPKLAPGIKILEDMAKMGVGMAGGLSGLLEGSLNSDKFVELASNGAKTVEEEVTLAQSVKLSKDSYTTLTIQVPEGSDSARVEFPSEMSGFMMKKDGGEVAIGSTRKLSAGSYTLAISDNTLPVGTIFGKGVSVELTPVQAEASAESPEPEATETPAPTAPGAASEATS